MIAANDNCINRKGGENMEVLEETNNGEIIQKGLEDFENIQRHIIFEGGDHA